MHGLTAHAFLDQGAEIVHDHFIMDLPHDQQMHDIVSILSTNSQQHQMNVHTRKYCM